MYMCSNSPRLLITLECQSGTNICKTNLCHLLIADSVNVIMSWQHTLGAKPVLLMLHRHGGAAGVSTEGHE